MSAPWDNLFSVFACCRDSLQGRKFDPNFYQNALDAADICGIGIMFKSDMSGALFVSSVVPDGPAHKAGNIMEGDVLFEVDGVNVYRCPASQCASSLMGPRGSKVRICFLRRGNGSSGTPFEVTMIRDFVGSGNGPATETNPSNASDISKRNPAFKHPDSTQSEYGASRRASQASSARQSDMGNQTPPQRWDGLWESRGSGWSPDKGRLSPEAAEAAVERGRALAASRLAGGSFGDRPPVAQEELERIKQKLDRQERWAETLGPNSPFVEPAGRSGRRSPPQKSPRARGAAEEEEKSDGRITPRLEEDPNIQSIRKKLDRQDKWIEKIFQQDKAKKKAAAAAKEAASSLSSTRPNGPSGAADALESR